jgi:hypothetical protein
MGPVRPGNETGVPSELLERILELAGTEMVLIGGQALAFWASYYQTPAPATAVTKDVDLLGTREDLQRLAQGLGATAVIPNRRAQTLLVGQIVKELPGGDYINIDVMHRVYGDITTGTVSENAVPADSPVGRFRVMHPVDVLQGRLENVYGLPAKRDEHGVAQLELAIRMVRAFIRDLASREAAGPSSSRRPVVLRHFSRIERMALSDAGRKVARRHGVHVADAIEPSPAIHIATFVAKKLPELLKLMSGSRRAEIQGLLKPG